MLPSKFCINYKCQLLSELKFNKKTLSNFLVESSFLSILFIIIHIQKFLSQKKYFEKIWNFLLQDLTKNNYKND